MKKFFIVLLFTNLLLNVCFAQTASNSVEVSGLTDNDCVLRSDMAGRTVRKFIYQQSNKFNIQNFAVGPNWRECSAGSLVSF